MLVHDLLVSSFNHVSYGKNILLFYFNILPNYLFIVKLLDEGKINLDDPVQKYVPNFPEKQINSKPCSITIRHLLCHQSGIRHYHKTNKEDKNSDTTKSK